MTKTNKRHDRYDENPLLKVYVSYNSGLKDDLDGREKKVLDAYHSGMLAKGAKVASVVKKVANQLHCSQKEVRENLQSIEEKGGYIFEPGKVDYPVDAEIWKRRNKGEFFGAIARSLDLKEHKVRDRYYSVGVACDGGLDITPYKKAYEESREEARRNARLAVRRGRDSSSPAGRAEERAVEGVAPAEVAEERVVEAAPAAPVVEAAPAAGHVTDRLPEPEEREEIGRRDTRPIPSVEDIAGGEQNAEQADAGNLEERAAGIRIPGRPSFAKKAGCALLAGAFIVGSAVAAHLGKEYYDNYKADKAKAGSESAYNSVDRYNETMGGKIEPMDKRDVETKTALENKAEADRKTLEAKRLADEAEAKRKSDEEARLRAEADRKAAEGAAKKIAEEQVEIARRAAEEARKAAEEATKVTEAKSDEQVVEFLEGGLSGDGESNGEENGTVTGLLFGERAESDRKAVIAEEARLKAEADEVEAKRLADEKAENDRKAAIADEEARLKAEADEAEANKRKAAERAERMRVKGEGVLSLGGISGDDGVGLGGRVSGSVKSGDFSAKGDVNWRGTYSDHSNRGVVGTSAEGGVKGVGRVGLYGGFETESEDGSSESVSEHDEGVFFRQHNREESKQTLSRWLASGRVYVTPADGLNVSADYSHDEREVEGKNLTETDVTFPNNPELQPVHVSNRVESLTRTLEDVLVARAGYDFGIVNPKVVGRIKRVAWDASASNNGTNVIDEGDTTNIFSGGLEVGFGNDDFRGRVTGLRHIKNADGHFEDVENSQKVEGAANIVVSLDGSVAAGVGGEWVNGMPKGRGLLFIGDARKNLSALGDLFAAIEDKNLFPDGMLEGQRFLKVFDQIANLGMEGLVVQGGVGGKDAGSLNNFEAGASIPGAIVGLPGSSLTALFEKTGNERRVRVEPRVLLGKGVSLGVYLENQKDSEHGESNEVGATLSGKF